MPINSKAKGKRCEQRLAGILRDYGFQDCRRTAQYCGNTGDASDIVGLPGIHIEAKHQEKMMLYDWMGQAVHDAQAAQKGRLPSVFHVKNNHEILVTMRLSDWITIYRPYAEEILGRDAQCPTES